MQKKMIDNPEDKYKPKNKKKALLVLLISVFCLTQLINIVSSSEVRVNIEPYLNRTCVGSNNIQLYAEYTECPNTTYCEMHNFTQIHFCPNGCDAVTHDCKQEPFMVNLIIIGVIFAGIIIIYWVAK